MDRLIEAFNAHDADAMAKLMAEDVLWLSGTDEGTATEAAGREELRAGMRGYFDSLPSVRSELEEATTNGSWLAVRERVSWLRGGEPRSQAALAVYEVSGGLIRRVWYYPAVR